MDKKKRNVLTLLGLFVLLSACLALYFFLPRGEDEEENAGVAEEITVDAIESDSIQRLEVKKKGKTEYVLVKKGDAWKLSGQENVPLDQDKVSALFSCLNPVKASKTLQKTEESMKEYGLQKPEYTIIVTGKDQEYRYDLGIAVPVEGGNYGLSQRNGSQVYCFAENLVSSLDIKTDSLIVRDELPQMEEEYMVYLKVDNKKGSDFEANAAKAGERVNTYSKWNITMPYQRPLAASLKNWSSVLGYFDSLTFGNLVEYDAGELKKYGLSNPSSVITVRYFETTGDYEPSGKSDSEEEVPEKYRKYHTLKLCIGDKKGKSYYACKQGSRNVYLMNEDVVENMTKLDVYEAMDHCVYATLATELKGYEAILDGTTLSVTRMAVKKSDGGDSDKNIWTLNGKQVPEDKESDFLMPYSNAYLLEYTERADDTVRPKKKKPVFTMIYHETKRDVVVKYYPYDGTNFYRVDRDGMNYFLVDKRSVDDVIKGFRAMEHIAD